MANCCICVNSDEIVAVEKFGAFKAIKGPGLHCLGFDVCGLIWNKRRVSARIQENRVKCETKTKDNVFVTVSVSVQQQVMRDSAEDAIYRLTHPAQQIDSYVANVIRGAVPRLTLDEVFVQKDAIAQSCQDELLKKMGEFGYIIHSVLVTDVDPAHNVKAAMNEINAARRHRDAANDRAEAEKIIKVKAAEADAESKFLQGQGIARQRAAIIDGLKASLGAAEQSITPERVSELLLITQYFDTLEKMSHGNATTIFLPHQAGGVADVASQMRSGILQGVAATPHGNHHSNVEHMHRD